MKCFIVCVMMSSSLENPFYYMYSLIGTWCAPRVGFAKLNKQKAVPCLIVTKWTSCR